MIKAIALVRTSTTAQEIEQQKKEVLEMCQADGLTMDEVELVGGKGLSAIKMDDEYLQNIQKVYTLIETTPSIQCVYAWAIDRIGRDDLLLTQFRVFMVKHRIQLKIRAQNLELLNPDGSENFNVKIQFNLYATLAQAEMQNKQARMLRGRLKNREQGRYNGGKTVKYGYYVDDRGFFQIQEDEAKVIRLIFQLLTSDEKRYSLRKLTAELQERGITMRGKKLPFRTVCNISRDTCYIGGADGRKMPRIVSDEIFYKVDQRLKENIMVAPKSNKHHYYGTKIVKCSNCGYFMTPSTIVYRCNAHINSIIGIHNKRGACDDAITLSIQYVDAALWEATNDEYMSFIKQDTADRKVKLTEQKEIIEQKKAECQNVLDRQQNKKKKIFKGYMDEIITEEEYERQIANVDIESENIKSRIARFDEEISNIDYQLGYNFTETEISMNAMFRSLDTMNEKNDEKMCELVHRFIKSMTAVKICTGKNLITNDEFKYDLSTQKNGFLFTIEAYSGKTYEFIYLNNFKRGEGHRLFQIMDNGDIMTLETKQVIDVVRGIPLTDKSR